MNDESDITYLRALIAYALVSLSPMDSMTA